MKSDKKYGLLALALALISVLIIWIVGSGEAQEKVKAENVEKKETIYSYVQLINSVAWNIDSKYVEEVDRKELIYSGIKGMLDILDPFSTMQDKKAHDRLMEVTEGKYEGLGMMIAITDDWITVISPIEGTPAYRMGLRAGDKIIEIDGKSTLGMTTEDAANLMRGPAGTKVVLKVKRKGLAEPLEYELERAVITLKNVPYYGVIENDIGYVRLSRFSEESGKELKDAIKELKEKKIKGLIFDLRSNGGGLLSQAVGTADLFLDKDKLVVYTKGREEVKLREFFSHNRALFEDKPLVVLVDEGTASASEIVAGAIQDWDKGVIIGDTTFGKGLVQQIYELPADVYLKLTVAKYYIPSGRCIQKPEKAKKHPEKDIAKDSTEKEEVFYTSNGRKVYGGGGVIPDVVIEPEELKAIEINLERKQMFFDFAVDYLSKNKDISEDFEVTEEILSEFKDFIQKKNFTYKTVLEMEFNSLEKIMKAEGKEEFYSEVLKDFEKLIEKEKELDFDRGVEYIKRSIRRDILHNLFGEKAVYEQIILKTDPCVKKAVEILTTNKKYTGILEGKVEVH